jgi:hypothetical protein
MRIIKQVIQTPTVIEALSLIELMPRLANNFTIRRLPTDNIIRYRLIIIQFWSMTIVEDTLMLPRTRPTFAIVTYPNPF